MTVRTARRIGRTLVALAAVAIFTFFASGYITYQNTDFPTPEEWQ